MKNLLITTVAILGLATITFGQTVPSYLPTNGLVGWWPSKNHELCFSLYHNPRIDLQDMSYTLHFRKNGL